jgi:hypothetical protein
MKELQFLLYSTPQEDIKVDVVVKDETIWLTQKAMAALFNVQVPAISKHLKNIFADGELEEDSVCRKFRHTAAEDWKNKSDFDRLIAQTQNLVKDLS